MGGRGGGRAGGAQPHTGRVSRPRALALRGLVPRPRGVEEKPRGSPRPTRESRLTRGGDQPGVGALTQWRRLVGGFVGKGSFSLPAAQTTSVLSTDLVLEMRLQDLPARCRPRAWSLCAFWGASLLRSAGWGCHPQKAACVDPAGWLVMQREQGV